MPMPGGEQYEVYYLPPEFHDIRRWSSSPGLFLLKVILTILKNT
jgi:hypothetical protein